MLGYVEEVAYDLAGMLVNPDAEPEHPVARAVAVAALLALGVAGLVAIYLEEGVIAL